MNQLFEKIKQTIKTDFQAVTDVVNDQKDPVTLLNKYMRESELEVKNAEKLIERQRMLKEEFNKELQEARNLAEKRREQGRVAIEAGADDLAEIALKLQAQAEQQVERLERLYINALEQLSELEQKHEEMKLKVKDMHYKRMELMGQENVLSMKEKMNKILDETEFGQAAHKFENIRMSMEQKESHVDDTYEMTIFDAKIKEIAKDLSEAEKLKKSDTNVIQ